MGSQSRTCLIKLWTSSTCTGWSARRLTWPIQRRWLKTCQRCTASCSTWLYWPTRCWACSTRTLARQERQSRRGAANWWLKQNHYSTGINSLTSALACMIKFSRSDKLTWLWVCGAARTAKNVLIKLLRLRVLCRSSGLVKSTNTRVVYITKQEIRL